MMRLAFAIFAIFSFGIHCYAKENIPPQAHSLFVVLVISESQVSSNPQDSQRSTKRSSLPLGKSQKVEPSAADLVKDGNRYWFGDGVSQNVTRAAEFYRKAAEMNNPEGETLYGEALFEGRGVPQDRPAAKRWLEKGAESQFARAEGDLGIIFRMGFADPRGFAEPPDQFKARLWLERAAAHGDALAEDQLGQFIQDYLPPNPPNLHEVYKHFMKAAEQGSAWGCFHMGQLYSYGVGVESDSREALHWFERGAELSDSDLKAQWGYLRSEALAIDHIMRTVAFMYRNGFHIPKDGAIAEQWFKKGVELERAAASSGWAAAQVALGHSYGWGTGLPKDAAEAKKWFLKAADQHYSEAAVALAEQLMFDEPRDYAMAKIWLEKGIELGSNSALYRMGVLYRDGLGVDKDYKQAIFWLEQVAETPSQEGLTSLFAMSDLGSIYKNGGFGVDRDYNRALQWFLKASERGNRWAQIEIGEMYEAGLGVKQNYQEAMSWYLRASKTYPAADVYIGRLYEAGKGVNRDLNAAQTWYQKAADDGVSDGQKALTELAANAGWSLWDEAIGKDNIPGGTSGAEFRARCENGVAKVQFRMAQVNWSTLQEFSVEVTFGNAHGNYTLKRNEYVELSTPVTNCSKIPKAVAKMPYQITPDVAAISTWEFSYKDGTASYKIKYGPSAWSMLGQAAVQGLSDYNAARHSASPQYPTTGTNNNTAPPPAQQSGGASSATHFTYGLSQCTKTQYEPGADATMWLLNTCNTALTVHFTSDSGQVWGTADVAANGRTPLWIAGMFDPQAVGAIHLFACPKGSQPVLANGHNIPSTTYNGEYTCK